LEKSKKLYLEAGFQELELADYLMNNDIDLSILHKLSAISCFIKGEHYSYALELIEEIEDLDCIQKNSTIMEKIKEMRISIISKIKVNSNFQISDSTKLRLFRTVLFIFYHIYGKIKSYGNFMKCLFLIKQQLSLKGKILNTGYEALYNPIFSKEVKDFIKDCLMDKYIFQEPDKSLILMNKLKNQILDEEEETNEILKKNVSNDIIIVIKQIIHDYGNFKSSEWEKKEKELGITKYHFKEELD
jgi:hypothetical protein